VTDRGNIYALRNLTHSYGRHNTLDIESLDIPEGGVIGLIGPNGSGKSTLLKVLGCLQNRRSGALLYDGAPVDGRERAVRREVTLLLQEPYLLRRSVYDNISYGLKLRGVPPAEIASRVSGSLARVGMETDRFARRPWYRLSGGEAQRVALAVRLALRPRVLLLDEPTANVDEASAVRIKEAVWHAWNDWGTTIVVATHDLVWLYEVATGIVSLYRGRAIGDGAENLIQGDWVAEGEYAVLSLRERKIAASIPEGGSPTGCARLNPSSITILEGPSRASPDDNVLPGRVLQMSMERSTGAILVVVDCDGISLRVRISAEAARASALCPGLYTTLAFSPSSLYFI
jgi:tungstate transport system ATP-binding protein